MTALIAIALLGSAGLASTWSGPLRRSTSGKHKHLMSQGVAESLMHVNVTSAYADAFCKNFLPSNLTTQHWVDQPMCERANTTFKVPGTSSDLPNCPRSPSYTATMLQSHSSKGILTWGVQYWLGCLMIYWDEDKENLVRLAAPAADASCLIGATPPRSEV